MVTLAEVAAAAAADPNNPYLGPSYAGPRPDPTTGLSGFQQGIGAPTDPNAPLTETEKAQFMALNMGVPLPTAPTEPDLDPARPISAEEQKKYGATPKEAAIANAGPTPGYETWEQKQERLKTYGANPDAKPPVANTAPFGPPNNVAAKVPGAVPVGGGAGGGAASLSPERARLASDDQSRRDEAELLNSEALINQRNQELLSKGEESAQSAIAKRETQRAADDASLAQMRAEMQRHAEERTKALELQAAETRAAKVDPNHWFKEVGVAGSILAALSIAAGAYAAAMPHSGSHENTAMKIIDGAIQRDVSAQEQNIANKWKSLNFQGDQNEKEYMKGQYMINAKRDATLMAYDHASALVSETRNATNNQVAISNLDKTLLALSEKKIGLTKEGAAQRESVAIKERASAAAGAAANPFSDTNMIKAYVKMTETAKPGEPVPSFEAWRATRMGGGTDGVGGSPESKHLADKLAPIASAQQELQTAAKDYAQGGALEGTSGLGQTVREALPGAVRGQGALDADQRWNQVTLAFQHAITGAGYSDKQAADIAKAAGGNGSAAARMNGIKIMQDKLDSAEKTYRAGAGAGASKQIPSQTAGVPGAKLR